MISITLDTDWAPNPVIEDTLQLLDNQNISATVFSTHDDNINLSEHERAIHPDFTGYKDPQDAIKEIQSIFPDAQGVRSHALVTGAAIRAQFENAGLLYESNFPAYGKSKIDPFYLSESLIEIPFAFMDDALLRGDMVDQPTDPATFDTETFFERSGTIVLVFHPIHVYLNTPSIEYYEKYKDHYHDDHEKLREYRYSGFGIRDLLLAMLEDIAVKDTETLCRIASRSIKGNHTRSQHGD